MIRAFARLLPNACVNDRGRRRTKFWREICLLFSARALSDLRPAAKTSERKLIAQRSVNCVIMVEQLMGTWLIYLNDRDLIRLASTIVRLLNTMMRLYYPRNRIPSIATIGSCERHEKIERTLGMARGRYAITIYAAFIADRSLLPLNPLFKTSALEHCNTRPLLFILPAHKVRVDLKVEAAGAAVPVPHFQRIETTRRST